MRTNQIKSLRPIIPAVKGKAFKTEIEAFHHQVLRPILKFQNGLILEAFQAEIKRFKIDFSKLDAAQKQEKLHSIFSKNQKFQMFLLGIVTGMLMEEEFIFFMENRRDVKKRILEMGEERVRSQLV